jgi:O-antigen/teichoic acid export membrane protein
MSVFKEVDKPLIASLTSLSSAGTYAAGSRFADAALMPIRAFIYATFRKILQLGADGPSAVFSYSLRILPACLGIALFVTVAVFGFAIVAPIFLGEQYSKTQHILQILALYPLFYAIYVVAVDALIAVDKVKTRTLVQILLPVMDILLCLILVPKLGTIGAAISCVAAYALSSLLAWAVLFHSTKNIVNTANNVREI